MGKSLVYTLILLVAVKVASFESTEGEVTSISYNKVETFLTTDNLVYHMELDLYLNDGSILFSSSHKLWNTDSAQTKLVLAPSGPSSLTYFHQLNSTHVAIVQPRINCIKMFNRKNSELGTLAGTCGSSAGYADGGVGIGKLRNPHGIVADITNPGRLLIADRSNNALRSVDVQTGELSTVTKTRFFDPRAMAWRHDSLLVTNGNYISMVSWLEDGTVTNTKLAGSTAGGNVEGSFDVARFHSLYDIAEVKNDIYLIADYKNGNLKLMNMETRTIGPVCTQGETPCKTSSRQKYYPLSLLKIGKDVLVGAVKNIEKLSDSDLPTHPTCPDNNITVTIGHGKETADVKLHCGNTAVLPPGIHEFKTKDNTEGCSYYVHIIKSPATRTLVFKAEYKVNCTEIEIDATRNVLLSVLKQRSIQLQGICDKNCTMSSTKQPWYDCKDNLLTAYWPTEDAMAADKLVPPKNLNSLLEERLDESANMCKEIAVISQKNPMVDAEKNADGDTIQIAIISSCADESLTYDSDKDACVEKDA